MAGEDGEGGLKRISKSVKVEDIPYKELDGREYDILGICLDNEFEIGISHSGKMEPLGEIIPEEIYESVAATVRNEIDVDALEIHRDNDGWPKLGDCVLAASGGEEVGVEITIFEL